MRRRLDTAPLRALGERVGSGEMQTHARLANVFTPQLKSHDRFGRRIDQVEFHPSYHALMASRHRGRSARHGVWRGRAGDGPCPCQTCRGFHALHRAGAFDAVPDLHDLCGHTRTQRQRGDLQRLGATSSPAAPTTRRCKLWSEKPGVTMGMGMTEKQGGSDVRANTTQAVREGEDHWGQRYRVTGHKWFFSAPMCDAFLILAQTASGLSCLFLPRVLPDGSMNRCSFSA